MGLAFSEIMSKLVRYLAKISNKQVGKQVFLLVANMPRLKAYFTNQ